MAARKKFVAGNLVRELRPSKNIRDPLPGQIRNQVNSQIHTSGISTGLYQNRQTNSARRSQIWVWENEGSV